MEKTFYRTVYTTGKGASAVGLTAAVIKDMNTKEWTLEGGAMVLADKGICLIDEFDKMNEDDRSSIHEAMEQQVISISKAGIQGQLQARCAIIAAANPVKGHYDNILSFKDNVNLSDPILSRFDILCVTKDEKEFSKDVHLSTFIINSHIQNHQLVEQHQKNSFCLKDNLDLNSSQVIPNQLLKKYILYARQQYKPRISKDLETKIIKFYVQLRQESQVSGGINIVSRHLESLIRICQASAKIRLSNEVNFQDLDNAMSILMTSFIQSQKFNVQRTLYHKF